MRKFIYGIIALASIINAQNAKGANGADTLLPENLYKHYTGTIGHHKAVMDIRYGFPGASSYGGSSYYFTDEPGISFFTITGPAAYSHAKGMSAQVFPENLPLANVSDAYSMQVQTTRFSFVFIHDSIRGKWYSGTGQEQLDINLKEDNTPLPFVFSHAGDTQVVTGAQGKPVKAGASYDGIELAAGTSKKDEAFIRHAVAQFAAGGKAKTGSEHLLSQSFIQHFISRFKETVQGGRQDGSDFTGIFMLFPVYSSDGLLVLQQTGYQYDFNSTTYTDHTRYLCLDIKNRKVLTADDMLTQNKDVLAGLLENALRKKYHIDAGKKLKDILLTDTMPVTDNVFPVCKGLVFSYSPIKVFRDDEDISGMQEMRLFLSYNELAAMLQPKFRELLGIK